VEPNHIPTIIVKRNDEVKQFFVLYCNGEPVGRAAVTVDKRWIETKAENLGFIDDLIIDPMRIELAHKLIDRCLAALKRQGIKGAIARAQGFPALAAQKFEELPPFGLPSNPPQYIDLYEQHGFVKHKEWANFRFTLPIEASGSALARWEKCLTSLRAEAKPLNTRNRRELKEYSDLSYEVLMDHFGYTPMRFMDSYSFIKFLVFGFFCRLTRFRVYVLRDKSGNMVGFFSYSPDYNIALKPLTTYLNRYNPLALPRFMLSLRRTKRAAIGAIGLSEEARRKGFIRAVDFGLGMVREEGYEQLDTGPVLIENAVVVKMIQAFQQRYDVGMEHMKYYTLLYRF